MKNFIFIFTAATSLFLTSCSKDDLLMAQQPQKVRGYVTNLYQVPNRVGETSGEVIYVDLNQDGQVDTYQEGQQILPELSHCVITFTIDDRGTTCDAVVSGSTSALLKLKQPGLIFTLTRAPLLPFGGSTFGFRLDGKPILAGILYFWKVDGLN